jgi:hypothetical protein
MPSREASLRNLAIARSRWRSPRPWRSRAESRLIRLYTWQWLLKRGPWCSGRALARWLGVSHTYIQKLTRTLSSNESDFLREVAHFGIPTTEGLRRTREESRQQRERGWLRTQPRWKTVEYKLGGSVVRDFVPTKPNAATLVANDPFLPNAPTPSKDDLNYNAIHMWNLKMNGVRGEVTRPSRPWRLVRRKRRR